MEQSNVLTIIYEKRTNYVKQAKELAPQPILILRVSNLTISHPKAPPDHLPPDLKDN